MRPTACEENILGRLGHPGGTVLDVGTAATGRTALLAVDMGYQVVSIDINASAVVEFSQAETAYQVQLAAADLQWLPFPADHFDIVLCAFHGMDYIIDPQQRQRAMHEIERVVAPGGYAVFDSYNPIGLIFRRPAWRAPLRSDVIRYLLRGRLWRSTFVDRTGLELHQAIPAQVVRETRSCKRLALTSIVGAAGNPVSRWHATFRSPEPYFVFRKTGQPAI